jgi:PE family
VSGVVAHLFSGYAEDFHGLAGRAAAAHERFVQNLKGSAFSYNSIEDAIAALLRFEPSETPYWNFERVFHNTIDFVYGHKWLELLLLPLIIPIALFAAIGGVILFLIVIIAAILSASAAGG